MLEFLYNKAAGRSGTLLLKRDSNTVVFLWNLQNFLEDLFWKISANGSFKLNYVMSFLLKK